MSLNRLWILLARKNNQSLTVEEQEELAQLLLQHPEAAELTDSFDYINNLAVTPLTTAADEERSRDSIASRLKLDETTAATAQPATTMRNRMPWYQSTLLWAAASCILVASIVWGTMLNKSEQIDPIAQNEFITNNAKSTVRLPDGSTVILNKQSKLVYNKEFGVNERVISLTGEAYFDVAHNAAVPLTVTAGPIRIVVKGTAFNVRAYKEDTAIEAALIRGRIEVSALYDPQQTIQMQPNDKVLFSRHNAPLHSANETPAAQQTAQPFVQLHRIEPNPTDSTINEIVWLQDKLVFKKEPFYSLAKKMERWYQVKFRFNDKISEQLSLTGSLEKETLTEALDALRQITPFNYKIDSNLVTISKKTTIH